MHLILTYKERSSCVIQSYSCYARTLFIYFLIDSIIVWPNFIYVLSFFCKIVFIVVYFYFYFCSIKHFGVHVCMKGAT